MNVLLNRQRTRKVAIAGRSTHGHTHESREWSHKRVSLPFVAIIFHDDAKERRRNAVTSADGVCRFGGKGTSPTQHITGGGGGGAARCTDHARVICV